MGESTGTLKVYLNESAGGTITFTEKTTTDNPFDGFDVGTRSAPTFADIDGDGKPDLVVGNYDGTLKYYLNESAGGTITFTEKTAADNPFDGFNIGTYPTPTFADIDGDGDLDLVVGEIQGTLKYYLNESASGTITFTEKTTTDNPFDGFNIGTYPTPTFADIDGDGDLDLVVGTYGGISTVVNHFGIWIP